MSRIDPQRYFSADYASARRRFRTAAAGAGARLTALELAARGPHGIDLSIDIAWLGSDAPRRAVIHSSGLHGVEGFAGSAVQTCWLEGASARAPDGAVILVHALNPFGMAWLRRTNENNVDLNRNWAVACAARADAPALYARLDPLLNPPSAPAADLFAVRLLLSALRCGPRALRRAIAAGQYAFPCGLFFGGRAVEEGPRRYRAWLAGVLGAPERLFVIDLHTGLGPHGRSSLFVERSATNEAAPPAALRGQVGADFARSHVGGYAVQGGIESLYRDLFPRTAIDFVTQEMGTYGALKVLGALRAENRWHHHGNGGLTHCSKRALMEAFCPAASRWRASVLRAGVALLARAVADIAA